jgi:phosphoketolase
MTAAQEPMHMRDHQAYLTTHRAHLHRESDPAFAQWAAGYGVIQHSPQTQLRIFELAQLLVAQGRAASPADVYRLLRAADRVTSAAMWLTVHMTYAQRVRWDGVALQPEEYKQTPEGHTGGSLNMVPAYAGYLAANALTGHTRGWIMGQGHSVAGIEAVNLLVGNMLPIQAQRYDLTDAGLTRFVGDFYSYAIAPDGRPASPLGSHVNANTAGGISEGGYLGFAELQYVHIPLPGERLVAFLSDGAFEEQRGSDWAPRWWRAEDSGHVAPIMILNGRRIEQRSTLQQQGGVQWLKDHLRLNGFDPMQIDGTDPAAFAWAIFTMEDRLDACAEAIRAGSGNYPVPLHYTIAEAPKGYGFPGAGSNDAHNLPLGANPRVDAAARALFEDGAKALWVSHEELAASAAALNRHAEQRRPRERDHAFATRNVTAPSLPALAALEPGARECSPMEGLDQAFTALVAANPQLRVRVGNPDELRSNRMGRTLDLLKHRVATPEQGVAESTSGSVVTALNEEAVVSAALANKGGLNLVVSYEAFAAKMLGALRQEILFARQLADAGRPPGWLSVVTVATSHTWENGKNEQSHQDPAFGETLLGEMSDVSRVLYPPDWNTAQAALQAAYKTHGQFWTMVVPKRALPVWFSAQDAARLVRDGAVCVRPAPEARILFTAVGAYQLGEALKAVDRLEQRGVAAALNYIIEPGRLRAARDGREAAHQSAAGAALFPPDQDVRIFLTHTRPEALTGILRPLDTGPAKTRVLGYVSRGGTLDVAGMLFANRATWAHAICAAAEAAGLNVGRLLDGPELQAVKGSGDPRVIMNSY